MNAHLDAVIDAPNSAALPAKAVELVQPGGRVVYIGVSGSTSMLDTRSLVLKDVTAVGILSASPGLGETIDAYAKGEVDPRPLISAAVGLEEAAAVLAGKRPADAGPGPRFTWLSTSDGAALEAPKAQ